ncbi:hypothetical protein QBC35DRAFT_450550 [Podospora australis]|uniref:N-acetyltransferase domain-containing protein n=1 Tax=Podospora australis TaxID=1536484 RepID=A0AAN7AKS3_9PEZI|nr:hypothetical protein QBC35DRAFT_450550 [Podospora australis]
MDLTKSQTPTVIQDTQSCIPLSTPSKPLRDGEIILLLTPGIVPDVKSLEATSQEPTSDPFEPLGKALAKHHPWVRHVPYLPRHGITGTHVVHIRLATVVVFVLSGRSAEGQVSQVSLAEITRGVCDQRPQIIVACCDVGELGPIDKSFPTIIQVPSESPSDLAAAADVIFGEARRSPTTGPNVQNLILAPKAWSVEVFNGIRDMASCYDLWRLCFAEKLHLNSFLFQSLLRRDGYAMHYVVREPGTNQLLGFCATYTTYADSEGERLVGAVAALVVHPAYRQRGIGLSLHNHAIRQLTKTRGVCRLQLGSTFPRLFYGPPIESPSEDWFRRRSWPITPGQEVSDWTLDFDDWAPLSTNTSGLTFRPCEFSEFDSVLRFVERECKGKDHVGWYDQYAKLANSMNIRDIVVALQGDKTVATALTYTKITGSPAAEDLPWANTVGDHVGGVTCLCIADDIADSRDRVVTGLLDGCIAVLKDYGMKQMFIDAVKGSHDRFRALGFRQWAEYRDVWREV